MYPTAAEIVVLMHRKVFFFGYILINLPVYTLNKYRFNGAMLNLISSCFQYYIYRNENARKQKSVRHFMTVAEQDPLRRFLLLGDQTAEPNSRFE